MKQIDLYGEFGGGETLCRYSGTQQIAVDTSFSAGR